MQAQIPEQKENIVDLIVNALSAPGIEKRLLREIECGVPIREGTAEYQELTAQHIQREHNISSKEYLSRVRSYMRREGISTPLNIYLAELKHSPVTEHKVLTTEKEVYKKSSNSSIEDAFLDIMINTEFRQNNYSFSLDEKQKNRIKEFYVRKVLLDNFGSEVPQNKLIAKYDAWVDRTETYMFAFFIPNVNKSLSYVASETSAAVNTAIATARASISSAFARRPAETYSSPIEGLAQG